MVGNIEVEHRKLIRQVIRQVHPDLFTNNLYERQCNSDSLKLLNTYLDELSKGRSPKPAKLQFFVKDGTDLRQIDASLPASGNLLPLFYAFGLITVEELSAGGAFNAVAGTDFLAWLRGQVEEAVRAAEQHEILKTTIRKLRSSLEEKHSLAEVQIGAEYAVSIAEQERQLESLKVLEGCLNSLAKQGLNFTGISFQLYHPHMCPIESFSFVDEHGHYNMRTTYMQSYVADDGCVHVVTDRATVKQQLLELDLERARVLTKVTFFWLKRVRELTPVLVDLLGVKNVWSDVKSEQSSQKFVLWAGYLLERRSEIKQLLGRRKFNFSIIVHSDLQMSLIQFHPSSPVLNVRSDCPPSHLIEFMISETGIAASDAAYEVQNSRAREEALMERVRQVFEAKCVIKICMSDKVMEGAQRLLDNAEVIKQTVDLRGACIALDDCYEVWESGFISIPYNFKIQELESQISRMLSAGPSSSKPSASSNGNSSSNSRMAVPTGMAQATHSADRKPNFKRPQGHGSHNPSTLRPLLPKYSVHARSLPAGRLPLQQRHRCLASVHF